MVKQSLDPIMILTVITGSVFNIGTNKCLILFNSSRDLAAAVNTGRVFAERCLKAGIVSVFHDSSPDSQGSEKVGLY